MNSYYMQTKYYFQHFIDNFGKLNVYHAFILYFISYGVTYLKYSFSYRRESINSFNTKYYFYHFIDYESKLDVYYFWIMSGAIHLFILQWSVGFFLWLSSTFKTVKVLWFSTSVLIFSSRKMNYSVLGGEEVN